MGGQRSRSGACGNGSLLFLVGRRWEWSEDYWRTELWIQEHEDLRSVNVRRRQTQRESLKDDGQSKLGLEQREIPSHASPGAQTEWHESVLMARRSGDTMGEPLGIEIVNIGSP